MRDWVIGAAVASSAWALYSVIAEASGTSYFAMGAEAEGWTADALKPLVRAGWYAVHNVEFDGRDIDHVVVGPGGVAAIETKWSSNSWHGPDNRERLAASCLQAWEGAASIAKLLRAAGNPPGVVDLDVSPILVLWGIDLRDAPEAEQRFDRNGVTVTSGDLLAGVLREQIGEPSIQSHELPRAEEKLRVFVGRQSAAAQRARKRFAHR